jgi:PKD repeat protein
VPEERTVTARVPAEYVVHAFRESGKEISISDITWNFGDGTVRTGMHVTHTYEYPGTYNVSITGNRSGFASSVSDTVRMTVRVIEPAVTLTEATAQYITLRNTGKEEADISGYVVREGTHTFVFPRGTVLLPGTNVRFPYATTRIVGGQGVTLYHPTGATVSVYGAAGAATQPSVARAGGSTQKASPVEQETVATGTALVPEAATLLTGAEYAFAAGAQTDTGRPLWWWLMGLGAAILATLVTIMLVRKEHEPERIAGFEIESDE